MNINWAAVSAIGQILSALFALVAVIVAVIIAFKQSKPRIIIKSNITGLTHRKLKKESVISIRIANVGMLPIQIDKVGIEFPDRFAYEPYEFKIEQLPIILSPGEVFKHDYMIEHDFRLREHEAFIGDICLYTVDGMGYLYKEKRDFLVEILRPMRRHYNRK